MTDPNLSIGSEVPNFIESFIEEAEKGLNKKGYKPCSESESHLKLELNATEIKEAGGGIKIHIVSFGGGKSDSNTQHMTLFAKKIDEVEEIKKKAEIEKAQIEIEKSKKQKEILNQF